MTLAELWVWIEANPSLVGVALVAIPAVVGAVSVSLRMVGRMPASQQVANAGIALGLSAVLIELMGLAFTASTSGASSIGQLSVAALLGPVWLLVAGFAVEHLVHPGRQEGVRSRVRGGLLVCVVVGVLGAVLSVLKIHMVVFSGIVGFLVFLGVVIATFWILLRYLI
jgi:hypothetical protein